MCEWISRRWLIGVVLRCKMASDSRRSPLRLLELRRCTSLRLRRSEVTRRLDEEASASPGIGGRVIYQHPLAYLLGLEGIALFRAFAGEYDREFTLARIQEIRALLDAADELGDGVEETPMAMQEGYAQWAPWYDEPGNELLEV